MTVVKDSIDTSASADKRFKKLKKIIENILNDTDPGKNNKEKRKWILWHFLYIIWWESTKATKRKQGGNGPARGIIQMEPETLYDLIRNYILGDTPGLVANLAKAAGVTKEEMSKALKAFKDKYKTGSNKWPTDPPANKIEEWLTNIDSFAIKLMRYYFKQFANHKFPPKKGKLSQNPQDDKFKKEHADGWGKWWKRKFKNDKERKRIIKEFIKRARELDRLAKKGAAGKGKGDKEKKKLQEENKKLKKEVGKLKEENKRLKEELKRLKGN